MLFCQLGRAHCLREIEQGLKSCEGKLSRLGIEALSKSSLSYANAHRPWQVLTGFMATYEVMNPAWAIHDLVELSNIALAERTKNGAIDPARFISQKVADKTRRFGIGRAFQVPHLIPHPCNWTPPRAKAQFSYDNDEDDQ